MKKQFNFLLFIICTFCSGLLTSLFYKIDLLKIIDIQYSLDFIDLFSSILKSISIYTILSSFIYIFFKELFKIKNSNKLIDFILIIFFLQTFFFMVGELYLSIEQQSIFPVILIYILIPIISLILSKKLILKIEQTNILKIKFKQSNIFFNAIFYFIISLTYISLNINDDTFVQHIFYTNDVILELILNILINSFIYINLFFLSKNIFKENISNKKEILLFLIYTNFLFFVIFIFTCLLSILKLILFIYDSQIKYIFDYLFQFSLFTLVRMNFDYFIFYFVSIISAIFLSTIIIEKISNLLISSKKST